MRAILTALTALLLLLPYPASAETVLRIGLNDEPDALDPTISRAYTGRLVFAALMILCYLYILYFAVHGHRAGRGKPAPG